MGRVNYDFDTGNWLIDMLAEVVVDPFNWISFGGKAAVSGGIKSVLVSSIDDVAQAAGTKVFKETIEEASKAGLKKKLVTYASRELLDSQGRLITKNIDCEATYRLIIHVNTIYINNLIKDIYNLDEER